MGIVNRESSVTREGLKALYTPMSIENMVHANCKNHGGLSTGPKTAEGIERIRRAVTKHGRYSAGARADRLYVR